MLSTFFSGAMFMPHGHCYLWQPGLVWLQVLSNSAIALAYVAIFVTLIYLVRRIEDIPFQWMYVAFAVFIVACGVTHIFDVYVIWHPAYWLDGTVRAITAVASVGTALMLPPLVPKAIALAETANVAHQRGLKLVDANRELGVLLDKTKELEQLKTQFFANVSHELRTPLTLILGPLQELLSADNLSSEQHHALDVALRNARSLLSQVNDLLDVSKLEAGRLVPEYQKIDVSGLVRVTALNFESLAADRKITYQVTTPDEQVSAELDPDKLRRVVLNLLSNAFKFTPAGGRIECALRVDGASDSAWITVSDSGPGIRPEDREIVFERFRQLEGGTTRRFGGTGLGLAIAKEFTELHGGHIVVRESREGGAQFVVDVPLHAPLGATVRSTPSIERLSSYPAPMRDSLPSERVQGAGDPSLPLVLVVEDNPSLSDFISASLQKTHRVATASNGSEGLRMAREQHPAAIVTDLMMPGMGGDELLRLIRADASLKEVPVVVLTAKADDDLRIQLLRDGAQDYLIKPFSPEELRLRVQNLVSMNRARELLRSDLESKTDSLEELAQEVTDRQRELKTAIESLRVARDQALRASEVKTNFLSMVSHELRTPLTVQRLQLDRLTRELGKDGVERHQQPLTKLERASVRLAHLVDSFLEYARIQSGRLTLEPVATDLGALVSTVVDEMRSQAEQKQLPISFRPDETLLPATVTDPRLVHLILVNLLANAIKFTDTGQITVRLELVGDRRKISVIDTGPGIPAPEQGRIFEAFERLEAVRRKHIPGVGLGLAIVREMADAIQANVELVSEPGTGSTFVLSLPAALA